MTFKTDQEKWWETGNTEDYKKEPYGKINYAKLVPLLVQSIQELTDEVNLLKEQLN